MPTLTLFLLLALLAPASLLAREKVYSGPQPGEPLTPFKVLSFHDPSTPTEQELAPGSGEDPVLLVFVHTVERSLVPLLRVIDAYAGDRGETLRTTIILLAADRITGEQRTKTVLGALQLKSRAALSLDGAEGPGNYGLNKECMMTVVLAKEGLVTHNFALVQPGVADAPGIVQAMAEVSGDSNPPAPATLLARQPAMQERGRMREEMSGAPDRPQNRPAPADSFPGAVPTDETLASLLRQIARPANEPATVNRLLAAVRSHVGGDPALRRQAIDGWTRLLHFGDRYGTEYSREAGAEFLKELKRE